MYNTRTRHKSLYGSAYLWCHVNATDAHQIKVHVNTALPIALYVLVDQQ